MGKFLFLVVLFSVFMLSCSESESAEVNKCDNVLCSGKGACVVLDDKAQCNCFDGYKTEGLECIIDSSIITCEANSCVENKKTVCSIQNNEIICSCDSGYHLDGVNCVVDTVNCEANSCTETNKTICTVEDNQVVCSCNDGYHLNGGNCVANDSTTSCNGVLCSGKGACVINNDGFATCNCFDGYYPDALECLVDYCYDIDCSGHGTCENREDEDTVYCECEEGYFDENLDCVSYYGTKWGTGTNEESLFVKSDLSDNLYVLGRTEGSFEGFTNAGSWDLFLSKFDSDGILLWTTQWGSEGDDNAIAMVVDSGGNTYISHGADCENTYNYNYNNNCKTITKINTNNIKEWSTELNEVNVSIRNMIIDEVDNFYIIEGNSLHKYNNNGLKLWSSELLFENSGSKAITVNNNNIYMYNNAEKKLKIFNKSDGAITRTIIIDENNYYPNIFPTTILKEYNGVIYILENKFNGSAMEGYIKYITLTKINENNVVLWSKDLLVKPSYYNYNDLFTSSMLIDTNENIYIEGLNQLVKLNADGTEQWIEDWTVKSMKLDTNNNLYVLSDYSLSKIDENKVILWNKPITGKLMELTGDIINIIQDIIASTDPITNVDESDINLIRSSIVE